MDNNRFAAPPQIGKIRDLNREESERLLALDFEDIEAYSELNTVATIVADELNTYRQRFNLDPIQVEKDAVRLIRERVYDADSYAQKASEGGAFFHPGNRKVFVRFSPEKYSGSAFEKMYAVYAVAHEIAHRAMEKGGLSRLLNNETLTFDRLNEGLVDWLAKDILNRRVLALVTTSENLQSRASYIQHMKPEIGGFHLSKDEILPTAPGENLVAFSYIPEMRLIELLQMDKPKLFQSLLKAAFEGNTEEASRLLEQTLGSQIRDELGNSKMSTRELIKKISERK